MLHIKEPGLVCKLQVSNQPAKTESNVQNLHCTGLQQKSQNLDNLHG